MKEELLEATEYVMDRPWVGMFIVVAIMLTLGYCG